MRFLDDIELLVTGLQETYADPLLSDQELHDLQMTAAFTVGSLTSSALQLHENLDTFADVRSVLKERRWRRRFLLLRKVGGGGLAGIVLFATVGGYVGGILSSGPMVPVVLALGFSLGAFFAIIQDLWQNSRAEVARRTAEQLAADLLRETRVGMGHEAEAHSEEAKTKPDKKVIQGHRVSAERAIQDGRKTIEQIYMTLPDMRP